MQWYRIGIFNQQMNFNPAVPIGETRMDTASVFHVLYWIAIISMAVVLVLVNIGIFAISFRFMKQRKFVLGAGACLFSIFCFYLIVLMINRTFL
ncbi:hypothetical protein MH117_24225 [Paenibacillus sp. ACRRX]|nr:hypothetical protein [Paenibacillus sp. ACRRX]